jgi:hypothetical protein
MLREKRAKSNFSAKGKRGRRGPQRRTEPHLKKGKDKNETMKEQKQEQSIRDEETKKRTWREHEGQRDKEETPEEQPREKKDNTGKTGKQYAIEGKKGDKRKERKAK